MKYPPFLHCAVIAMTVCLPACRAGREAAESDGGSRLDPTSSASRQKLDSAQRAFGGQENGGVYGGGEMEMKAFRTGGSGVGMTGFATKNFKMKGASGMSSFEGGNSPSSMNSKSFSAGASSINTQASDSSNRGARLGGSSFAAKGYRTKAFRGTNSGFRFPSSRSAKVTPVEDLIDSSVSDPGAASVGDIRSLLNR